MNGSGVLSGLQRGTERPVGDEISIIRAIISSINLVGSNLDSRRKVDNISDNGASSISSKSERDRVGDLISLGVERERSSEDLESASGTDLSVGRSSVGKSSLGVGGSENSRVISSGGSIDHDGNDDQIASAQRAERNGRSGLVDDIKSVDRAQVNIEGIDIRSKLDLIGNPSGGSNRQVNIVLLEGNDAISSSSGRVIFLGNNRERDGKRGGRLDGSHPDSVDEGNVGSDFSSSRGNNSNSAEVSFTDLLEGIQVERGVNLVLVGVGELEGIGAQSNLEVNNSREGLDVDGEPGSKFISRNDGGQSLGKVDEIEIANRFDDGDNNGVVTSEVSSVPFVVNFNEEQDGLNRLSLRRIELDGNVIFFSSREFEVFVKSSLLSSSGVVDVTESVSVISSVGQVRNGDGEVRKVDVSVEEQRKPNGLSRNDSLSNVGKEDVGRSIDAVLDRGSSANSNKASIVRCARISIIASISRQGRVKARGIFSNANSRGMALVDLRADLEGVSSTNSRKALGLSTASVHVIASSVISRDGVAAKSSKRLANSSVSADSGGRALLGFGASASSANANIGLSAKVVIVTSRVVVLEVISAVSSFGDADSFLSALVGRRFANLRN